MNEESKQPQPNQPVGKNKSPALPLVIGFIPSVLVLAVFAIATNSPGNEWVGDHWHTFFGTVGVARGGGCFVSSRMLFRFKTKLVIVGAVVLLILNLLISLFLGCVAAWQGV